MSTVANRITIKRLHPLFAAEVTGIQALHRTTIAGKAPDTAFAAMPGMPG